MRLNQTPPRNHAKDSEKGVQRHHVQRSENGRAERAAHSVGNRPIQTRQLIRPLAHLPARRPAVEPQLAAQLRMQREGTEEDRSRRRHISVPFVVASFAAKSAAAAELVVVHATVCARLRRIGLRLEVQSNLGMFLQRCEQSLPEQSMRPPQQALHCRLVEPTHRATNVARQR